MTQVDAFLKTARQAIRAAQVLQDGGDHAAAAYYACHAFEMAGNAFIAERNIQVRRNHRKNLNNFKGQYHGTPLGKGIAPVFNTVIRLRHDARYPSQDPSGDWIDPSQAISSDVSSRLVSQVGGVLRTVRRNL